MTENNGWSCCGIPAPKEAEFDWRKKAAGEEEETPAEQADKKADSK